MPRPRVTELLGRAVAALEDGDREAASRLYDEAVEDCRASDDLEGWAEAVRGAASAHIFGTEPGRLPAQLYEVLQRTSDKAMRARLGAELARCWVYSGQQERGLPFAEQALHDAEELADPELVADCLDAALAAHWGPDDLEMRRALTVRLDAVAAHVLDPDTRLKGHLWGLQVACELLDLYAIHRHLRALELLGDESDRARFFALTRRVTIELMSGRTDLVADLLMRATDASRTARLADAWMVVASQRGYAAAMSGDRATCADLAEQAEGFAAVEGAPEICAEAAFLWSCAERPDRAGGLVATFRGSALDDLPRDVNWLLTVQCVLEAALAVGDREVIATAARLLTPYAGRAVVNAGAVMFHGLVDDTLSRAAGVLGDPRTSLTLRDRAIATYDRVGAAWWRKRLDGAASVPVTAPGAVRTAHLHPTTGGLWLVGCGPTPVPVAALRGFGYLAELLRRPGEPVAALDLVGRGTGVLVEAGLGETIDRQAMAAYRSRLVDLQQEIDEAEEWADLGRLQTLQAERDALVDELTGATGLGGRSRFAGGSGERARVAIQKAIAAAIGRVAAVDEGLGRHLKASIRTGRECRYEPDPEARYSWVLTDESRPGATDGHARDG